jgi:hypothetical protein
MLIPRVRIKLSSYRDFRIVDQSDEHTYTPVSLPGELKMIFVAISPIGGVGNKWKLVWSWMEMMYERSVPAYYLT